MIQPAGLQSFEKNDDVIYSTTKNCRVFRDIKVGEGKVKITAPKITVNSGVKIVAKEIEFDTEEIDCKGVLIFNIFRTEAPKSYIHLLKPRNSDGMQREPLKNATYPEEKD